MSKILKYTDWKHEQALWLQTVIDHEIILGSNKYSQPFDAVVMLKYQEYLMFFQETRFNEELRKEIIALSNKLHYFVDGRSNPDFDPDLHRHIDELMDELTNDL
jgi:hypothetical protein